MSFDIISLYERTDPLMDSEKASLFTNEKIDSFTKGSSLCEEAYLFVKKYTSLHQMKNIFFIKITNSPKRHNYSFNFNFFYQYDHILYSSDTSFT